MSTIFHRQQHQKFAIATLSSVTALTLLLSGCSSSEDSAEHSASANSSHSASTSTTEKSSEGANASAETTDSSSSAPEDSTENFEDAPAELASASPVALDNQDVKQTENVYSQFNDVLSHVEITTTTDDSGQGEETEVPEDAPKGESKDLSEQTQEAINKVATGVALDEFSASALEFGVNGWTQEGSPKFVGEPKITDMQIDGKPAKLLEVCVDSSNVVVKDGAGNSLTSDAAAKRSLNLFTLVNDDGTWKIASRQLPNNPDC